MARKAGKVKQSQDSHGTESRSGPGVGGTPAHHPAETSSPAYSGSQQTISTEKILESLEEAKKLESQLEILRTTTKSSKRTSSSQGGNDDISTQKIRCMLCDKLSNIILDDPLLSESNDVVNRLWKICFYNRINELRSLITKERSKAKKKLNPLPGESVSVKAAEQAKLLVAQYETQYKQFLNEAIKLYQYIIDRYTKELSMPPLSQTQTVQSQQQQSQLSQSSTTLKVAPDDERSLVVISSLYKLNIHLGDLYRYSTQYKLSTNCYLNSSKLAPSTGNPYNQLAVVAQSSSSASSSSGGSGTAGDNQTVVALYYYARSLLATSIPFETSRSNLVRLFESNGKWMKEHLRDTNNTINIDMGKEIAPVGLTKKEQKEWLNKLRTTNNRKCLVMLVDLQWMFFKGVSLENNSDGSSGNGGGGGSNKGEREKVDLQTLLTKMKSINNTISNLINHSSFSESLLLKLLSIFTFSTITSGNGGKIINAQGFDKKRLINPSWNKEDIIITNQALVFSFLLDFITLLCDDVSNLLVKKMSSGGGGGNGGNNVKLGTIRSLSALLLGVRYITMLYDGECEWFHGLPFFPTSNGDGGGSNKLSRGSTIHTICQVSHTKFWKSLANLTNQIDTLPTIQRLSQEIEDITEIGTIKEYNELHGYVPFTSFLDNDDNNCMLNKDGEVTEYVNVANAIKALDTTEDDTSKGGGGGKGSSSSSSSEGATKYKLNLLVSIVNKKTILFKSDDMLVDGRQFFLTRKSITDKRELITDVNNDEEEDDEEESVPEEEEIVDEQAVAETNFSPDVDDMDVEDDNKDEEEEEEAKGPDVPFLLTPAALLAASGGSGSVEGVKLDSILASSMNPEEPYDDPHKTTAAAAAAADVGELLLNNAFPPQKRQQLEVQQVNVPLPPPPGIAPPPGISLPPGLAATGAVQPQLQQQPPAPGMGISLADFTTAPPQQQAQQQQGHISFGRGTNQMPQDVPSYPSNMFETMNPFVQAPPPLAPATQFNNSGMVMNSSSSSLNQLPTSLPPGLLNTVGQQQQPPPPQSTIGLDSTLDFLLSSTGGSVQPSTAAGNAFNNLLVPSTSKEENDGESILNFLFDSSGTASSTNTGAGQPLYGVPQTKNPFAT